MRPLSGLLVVCALGSLAGCGQFEFQEIAPGSPTPTPVPKFCADVIPIFTSHSCWNGSACHSGASSAPSSELVLGGGGLSCSQVYTLLVTSGGAIQRGGAGDQDVNLGNPATSMILTQPDGEYQNPTHTGGTNLIPKATPDYETILAWITAGAPND